MPSLMNEVKDFASLLKRSFAAYRMKHVSNAATFKFIKGGGNRFDTVKSC